MVSHKLTDSEKEVRKKKRNKKMFDSYKTYSGPRGTKEEWQEMATLILSEKGNTTHLQALGLSTLPNSLDALNRARKKAMLTAHPDRGGVNEQAVKINESYDMLKMNFAPSMKVSFHDGSKDIELARATHVEHEDFSKLWIDSKYINPNFIVEKKMDGSRYALYLEETCKLLSKRVSTVTKKYVDKTLNCPHLTRIDIPKEFWSTVLDGEMVHPKSEKSDDTTSIMGCSPEEAVSRQKKHGWLRFCVYDLPRYKGEDLRNQPLKYRKDKLASLIKKLQKYIPVEIIDHMPSTEAETLFNDIVSKKGEGVMLKDLNALYGEGWFKVKKTVTWDVVVMGFEAPKKKSKKSDGKVSLTHLHQKGYIGAIIFGAYRNGTLTELGTCSGMSESIRKEFSLNGESYIGQVIEIKFQERTKSGALRHARFIKIRKDKSAIQCVDTEF